MRWACFVGIGFLVLGTGCASSGTDSLRTRSMEIVGGLADMGKSFLEENSEEQFIEVAKSAVRYELRDPESAQFRNVRVEPFQSGHVVCGQVNGKNAYGGYVGFKDFVAGVGIAVLATESRYAQIESSANAGLNAACYGISYGA